MGMVLLAAYAALAVWLYLLFARGGYWRVSSLEEIAVPMPAIWPEIAVIIPARNEAGTLTQTLHTLLGADYPAPLRIILVDDRSEDATASVAARIADYMGTSSLEVITARALPAGWTGKVWAMQCGLEHIAQSGKAPRYIVFTDADIAYDKGALCRLVAHAEAGNFTLASLMVRLRCRSMAERFLVPAFVYFFRLLYPFGWVNEPQRSMAAAAGGSMLVRYDALQKAGGLEPISAALIDDCALGRLMKQQGAIWLGLTQSVHSIRTYPQVRDIRAMVARTAYDQLGYCPFNLIAAVLSMMITYIVPVMLTFFASGMAQWCGIIAWAAMTLSFIPIVRFYNRAWLWSLALPLIAVCYMGFTLDSAYQYLRGKGGLWKGRFQANCGEAA